MVEFEGLIGFKRFPEKFQLVLQSFPERAPESGLKGRLEITFLESDFFLKGGGLLRSYKRDSETFAC